MSIGKLIVGGIVALWAVGAVSLVSMRRHNNEQAALLREQLRTQMKAAHPTWDGDFKITVGFYGVTVTHHDKQGMVIDEVTEGLKPDGNMVLISVWGLKQIRHYGKENA